MFHEIASGTRYVPPQPEVKPENKPKKEGPTITGKSKFSSSLSEFIF